MDMNSELFLESECSSGKRSAISTWDMNMDSKLPLEAEGSLYERSALSKCEMCRRLFSQRHLTLKL